MDAMKKIGIVGGVGWRSTLDYYKGICRLSEEWHGAVNAGELATTPEMSIESLDLRTAVSYLGNDIVEESWIRFDEYHRVALQRLEASGAEFALIASNTPHHRLASITSGMNLPVISIYDAVAAECARMGAGEVLILGTSLTMSSLRLREEFANRGVLAFSPPYEEMRNTVLRVILELQTGEVADHAQELTKIAEVSFRARSHTQPLVCLVCTELPLAFPEQQAMTTFERDGIFYFNSSAIHIRAAFRLSAGIATDAR